MGWLGRVLSFERVDINDEKAAKVKCDKGGGDIVTPVHCADSGDDSQPLPQDIPAAVEVEQTGAFAAVGYIDPKNPGIAKPGEKRIYARNIDGVIVSSFYMEQDGTVTITNEGGAEFILLPNGSVTINGKDWDTHTHGNGSMQAGGDNVTGTMGGVS